MKQHAGPWHGMGLVDVGTLGMDHRSARIGGFGLGSGDADDALGHDFSLCGEDPLGHSRLLFSVREVSHCSVQEGEPHRVGSSGLEGPIHSSAR
jgi:hypothetical protein